MTCSQGVDVLWSSKITDAEIRSKLTVMTGPPLHILMVYV